MYNMSGKRRKTSISVLLAAVCLLVFIYGCSGTKNYTSYTRPQFDIAGIKKIAVLPFENYTSEPYAAERVRRAVMIELMSRGVEVTEPGEITAVLRKQRIRSIRNITVENIRDIGDALGVDAVMKGSVGAFGIRKGISVTYPEVSVNLTLIEPESGDIIWAASNTSGGAGFWTRHFGVEGPTLDEAAAKVVREALDTLFQ
ncbi:MAG: hypothetical protein GXP46_03585 [Deferribacteres bacterium]|nr:hypothetical protein [Deferribacteres bacterium]